ncbi:MAG: hypothetical protein WC875_01865 [Candidatus Absconditabacterales bacterium]|jgi:hypothetical protein
MRNSEIIPIVDEAFANLRRRKGKKNIIIKYITFDNGSTITIPSGAILQASFVKIILVRKDGKNNIKVLHRDNDVHQLFPYNNSFQKEAAIGFLRQNKILPSKEEFLAPKSFAESLSAEDIHAAFAGD